MTSRAREPSTANRLSRLVDAQDGKCFYCNRLFGEHGRKASLDHLIPKWMGLRLEFNTIAACTVCNTAKGPLDIMTFMFWRAYPAQLKEIRRAFDKAITEMDAEKKATGQ